MKKSFFQSGAIVLGILALSSCDPNVKKDEIKKDVQNQSINAVEKFFDNRKEAPQKFSVNPESYITVTANKGTIISIPANVFEYANGSPVEDNVTLDVKEIFEESGMILSGVTTQSNGQILVSGGELFISATANGQEVFLDENATISIQVPIEGSPDSNMGLFVDNQDSSGVNWTLADTSIAVRSDTLRQNFYYSFSVSNLGWINCDYFYNRSNTYLTVNMPSLDALAGKTVKYANCFAVYKDFLSVTDVYAQGTCQATTCPTHSFRGLAGLNEPVYLITIADIGGKLHYSKKEITITANLTINLQPSDLVEVSEEQLNTILESL
ncbi:MAG: hypothetical protein MUF42_05935 [Cytophagaceae bacterium]|jgi:hypothetical protein|nr:hypothetical protein [Cytophagaceae bacterium]